MIEMLLTNAVDDKGKLGTAQKIGNNGGGSVTAADIVTATGQMDSTQQGNTRTNIGAASNAALTAVNNRVTELITTVTAVSGTTPSIAAEDNTIYECGELTSLTVSSIPQTGDFIIRFTSGATATTTSFPVGMKFPEAFAAEANTRYEINCSNGYALAVGWPAI